jgi:3-hydroxyisobutyrate dehydrogenase
MAEAKPVVGFVGLGEQGTPIAHRILGAGYPMALWARRAASFESFAGSQAEIASDLHDLGARSDIVCLCVLNDEDVIEVLEGGIMDALAPGSLIVVNSTTQPETCRRLATVAASHGSSLVDAPVSGMARGAVAGTMAIFVGGRDTDFERYAPVARTFGTPTHMGDVGTGQATKLLNNMTAVCNLVLVQDALAIGGELDIDRDVLTTALMTGSAASRFLDLYRTLDYDPVLHRNPDYFLRDWSRILSDFRSMLGGRGIDGRLIDTLGGTFIDRTRDHVTTRA